MLTYKQAVKECVKDLNRYKYKDLQLLYNHFGVDSIDTLARVIIDENYPDHKANMDPVIYNGKDWDTALEERDMETLKKYMSDKDWLDKNIRFIAYDGVDLDDVDIVLDLLEEYNVDKNWILIFVASVSKIESIEEILKDPELVPSDMALLYVSYTHDRNIVEMLLNHPNFDYQKISELIRKDIIQGIEESFEYSDEDPDERTKLLDLLRKRFAEHPILSESEMSLRTFYDAINNQDWAVIEKLFNDKDWVDENAEEIYVGEFTEYDDETVQRLVAMGIEKPYIDNSYPAAFAVIYHKFDIAEKILKDPSINPMIILESAVDSGDTDTMTLVVNHPNFNPDKISESMRKSYIDQLSKKPEYKGVLELLIKKFLPYGGNIQQAMRAQDRAAIRQIMEYNRSQESRRNTQLVQQQSQRVIPEHSKECSNSIDFASQEEWSDTVKPVVKIHYMNYDDIDKLDQTICYAESPFKNAPEFGIWIANDKRHKGKPDDEGFGTDGSGGFGPSSQRVKKLPDSNFVIIDRFDSNNTGEFTAIPIGKVRLGNLRGSYGISQLHGQAPDKVIYLIMKNADDIKVLLQEYLENMILERESLGAKYPTDIEMMPILELLKDIRRLYQKIPAVDNDYDGNFRSVRSRREEIVVVGRLQDDGNIRLDLEFNSDYDSDYESDEYGGEYESDEDQYDGEYIEDLDLHETFIQTILRNDIEKVKQFLQEGIDPSDDDNRAIKEAAEVGHTDIVKLLLTDSRVDPSSDNNIAITRARQGGHTEIVELLEQAIAERN